MTTGCAIRLVDVKKSFGAQQVLKGVDLCFEAGKTTVIVGESGQGKSVIIKLILGLTKPDSGEIWVDGVDITKISSKKLREVRNGFGVLFQNVALFDSMTVYDNVAFPLRERTKLPESKIREIVSEKLTMMDAVGHDAKFPDQLSGGLKKRVGLARALVLDPKIVFFDEPTTGLDAAKSNEIYRVFFRSQSQLGYTSIIVSHDAPKIFKLADYVALLHRGFIEDCVTPEEFQISENPVIRNYVKTTMGSLYVSDKMEGESP